MEWSYLRAVTEQVNKLTKSLEEETTKVKQLCESYRKLVHEELATPEESRDFDKVTEGLGEIQDELKIVQEKGASENIIIKFAGPTSSGKSSLINALLRSRRLPVGFMQTTMCSIKVCTTEGEEWSVTVTDKKGQTKCLSETKDEKAIKDLLSQMSGKKNSQDRKKLGIGPRSVVQVNWPRHLCQVLPENVVLTDTPGLGEDVESDEVVTKSCREADIVVAVMDAMSPSKATVAKLVSEVDCQFTFGVFTKWDECIRKANEESEVTVDVEQAKEDYKQNFQDALKGRCEVFFVDVKCENNNDPEFERFENKLADSAAKLKGESMIKQAKSVNNKSTEIAKELKAIVDARKQQKEATIKKKEDSIQKDSDSFEGLYRILQSAEELKESTFNESTRKLFLKEFEKEVKKGRPEAEVYAEFIAKVDKSARDTIRRQRNETRSDLKEWTENHNWDLKINELTPDELPQCEKQGLGKTAEEYDWRWDPNTYYTDNYLTSVALLGGLAGGAILLASGVGALAGLIAAEALPVVAGAVTAGSTAGGVGGFGGTLLGFFRTGDRIKRYSPISDYKVNCWRKKLRSDLINFHKACRDLIFNEIQHIEQEASKMLENAKAKKSEKIQILREKAHNLADWATDIQESHTRFTEINKEFDELLTELQKAEEVSSSMFVIAANQIAAFALVY